MKLHKADNRNIKSQKPLQQENVKPVVKREEKDKADDTVTPVPVINVQNITTEEKDKVVDSFRQTVYVSGKNLLKSLEEKHVEYSETAYKEVSESLNVLEKFQYDIAFAGEQSSGKSSVINALVGYPIMPVCKLTTTGVGTKMIYSETTRIIVTDDDSKMIVMDVDCTYLPDGHFKKLKEYACATSGFKLIENLQYFTDKNLFNENLVSINELKMEKNNPNHVALLLMILLTVYIDQNNVEDTDSQEDRQKREIVTAKRKEVLKYFRFPQDTLNYSITLQWDNEFLKNGMVIIDLPGLGAYAPDKEVNGKVQKGHDAITIKTLGGSTDAMVFLVDPEVRNTGAPALETMLSNANLRETVGDDIIIPVLNKIDRCSGDAEVTQAVNSFVNLIRGAGVKKSSKDVKLCSALFGEARYKVFPLERTLYYKRDFAKIYEYVREDMLDFGGNVNEQQIVEKAKARLKRNLQRDYDKSHIEELTQFFRLSYVQKGKCYKICTPLLKMITFSATTYHDLVSKKNNAIALRGLQSSAIEKITAVVNEYAAKPINTALGEIEDVREHSLKIMDELVKTKLQTIPGQYSSAFDSAVSEYKEKLLKIANDFETYAWGLGSRARIDIEGSKNRRLYFQLKRECNIMKIDVKSINRCYAETLELVTEDITRIYDIALKKLQEMKESFSITMEEAVQKILEDEEMQNNSKAIKTLADNITDYVEKNISIIENQSKVSKTAIDEVGKTVANSIINFNEECISSFSLSVVSQVQGALAEGFIFTRRQYIIVDGQDGIKALFNNLSYSENDKIFMGSKVAEVGTTEIYNQVNQWYTDAGNTMSEMFTDLIDKIKALLKSTLDILKENADESQQIFENVCQQISVCEDELVKFRNSVQGLLDWSLRETGDSRLSAYQGDMFGSLNLQG